MLDMMVSIDCHSTMEHNDKREDFGVPYFQEKNNTTYTIWLSHLKLGILFLAIRISSFRRWYDNPPMWMNQIQLWAISCTFQEKNAAILSTKKKYRSTTSHEAFWVSRIFPWGARKILRACTCSSYSKTIQNLLKLHYPNECPLNHQSGHRCQETFLAKIYKFIGYVCTKDMEISKNGGTPRYHPFNL